MNEIFTCATCDARLAWRRESVGLVGIRVEVIPCKCMENKVKAELTKVKLAVFGDELRKTQENKYPSFACAEAILRDFQHAIKNKVEEET